MVNIPNEKLVEESDFYYVSGFQLQTASWLRVGVCVYFCLSMLDLIWLELVKALCVQP